MSTLAIHGGTPVRTTPFPNWPVWDETDEKALLATLRAGVWGITDDPDSPVHQFEREFARVHDARFGVSVTNGTAALQIALMALDLDYGDEVIFRYARLHLANQISANISGLGINAAANTCE